MRFSRFQRTAAATAALLLACGDVDPPLEPVSGDEPPDVPVAIAIVSGDGQEGKAGEALADSLVVRVTAANGHGVGSVPVTWTVSSGAGSFPHVDRTETRWEGRAATAFTPAAAGRTIITARARTATGSFEDSVRFTAEVNGIVILVTDDFGWSDVAVFRAPDGSSNPTVPVGTSVEWVNWVRFARVTSTAAPPDGAHFDSGTLRTRERYEFVPRVPGTWEYVDEVSGATGRLTAGDGGS